MYSLILFFLLIFFTSTTLSAPAKLDSFVQNLTSDGDLLLPLQYPPGGLPNSNLTSLGKEPGDKYHVPFTQTTLFFYLGFPMNRTSMANTIKSARKWCELEIESGGGPLPYNEEPFLEDLGYGAAIKVTSARPDHRLTWRILKEAMQGLWDYLILQGHPVEAEFDITHAVWNLVGRGTIGPASVELHLQEERKRGVRVRRIS